MKTTSAHPARRAVLAGAVLAPALAGVAAAPAEAADGGHRRPTIVIVHGAFADAAGFADVVERLQRRGYPVIAPANPLRGLAQDSAYVASVLATLTGPLVLVGHSYGGAVITNAGAGNPQVRALVYLAAYALAEGESAGDANALGGHPEESALLANLLPRTVPGGGEENPDLYVDPAEFRAVFCADLPARRAAVLSATQRPAALSALGEESGEPAWKTVPSWYVVAGADRAIPPTAERAMAARAGSTTTEVRGSSHVVMISHPDRCAEVIVQAARA